MKKQPLKLIVHPLITSAFLAVQDANVIVVDWNRLANSNYNTAAAGVPKVLGQHLGNFLVWLINTAGGNWNNVHLVGFSLGVHVVDRNLKFVNRGVKYETTLFIFCSHGRATELIAASVRYNRFVGRQCPNISEAELSTCGGAAFNMDTQSLTSEESRSVCVNNMNLIILTSITLTVVSANNIKQFESRYFKNEGYYPSGDEERMQLIFDLLQPEDEFFVRDYTINPNDVYLLFTRNNPYTAQNLVMGDNSSVSNSNFDGTAVTVFLVHGWNGHGRNSMNLLLTKAFLEDGDVNVIVVDWSDLATKSYITAKAGVPKVGRDLGIFVNWLVSSETSYDKIHLVGFSLGAHIVGNAGRTTAARIQRITALDPGGPLWKKDKNRLMPTDARYVEVIHTNTALYGLEDPCGDADFYPNGGYRMPGCILNYCSHRRSYEYLAATLKSTPLMANECNSLQDAFDDNCYGLMYPMGNSDLAKSRSGIFRLNTNDRISENLSYI
ncbi:unnamed protein product, partial [Iphiclides podalirius]